MKVVHGPNVGLMYKTVLDGAYEETRSMKNEKERHTYLDNIQQEIRTGTIENLTEWYKIYSNKTFTRRRKK